MSRVLPQTSEILIREAVDGDGGALSALIASVYGEYEGVHFLPEELPELKAPASHFRRRGGRLWVAEQAGRLVGSFGIVATHERGIGEFLKVYLAREHRGAGVAKRLYDRALAFARDRDMHTLTLWTDTRFLDGHRFYVRRGFRRMPGIRAVHDVSRSLEFNFRLDALPRRPE